MDYTAYLLDMEYMRTTILKRYVVFLSLTQAYKTIKLTINGVRLFYIGRGLPNPLADNYQHTSTCKESNARKETHRPRSCPSRHKY